MARRTRRLLSDDATVPNGTATASAEDIAEVQQADKADVNAPLQKLVEVNKPVLEQVQDVQTNLLVFMLFVIMLCSIVLCASASAKAGPEGKAARSATENNVSVICLVIILVCFLRWLSWLAQQ